MCRESATGVQKSRARATEREMLFTAGNACQWSFNQIRRSALNYPFTELSSNVGVQTCPCQHMSRVELPSRGSTKARTPRGYHTKPQGHLASANSTSPAKSPRQVPSGWPSPVTPSSVGASSIMAFDCLGGALFCRSTAKPSCAHREASTENSICSHLLLPIPYLRIHSSRTEPSILRLEIKIGIHASYSHSNHFLASAS